MLWKASQGPGRHQEDMRQQMLAFLPRLRRFARYLAGDAERGDELVQTACERGLKRQAQFRDGTRLDSWMYWIIHTQWIDRLCRHKSREAARPYDGMPPVNLSAA